jgi:sialic acid synthase SpsE
MHCVSSYPTPFSECNLSMIKILRERYGLLTGYSGHEIGYLPTLTAVSIGADIIERHFTLDNNMIGFDHKISLEPDELYKMVKDIRTIKEMFGLGEKLVSNKEFITRNKYHVSMTSKDKIPAGTILTEEMVIYKNPGTGISYKNAHKVLGKKTKVDISSDILIHTDMFE